MVCLSCSSVTQDVSARLQEMFLCLAAPSILPSSCSPQTLSLGPTQGLQGVSVPQPPALPAAELLGPALKPSHRYCPAGFSLVRTGMVAGIGLCRAFTCSSSSRGHKGTACRENALCETCISHHPRGVLALLSDRPILYSHPSSHIRVV